MWTPDIWLAVFGFIVQCALAWLGLALNHWKFKTAFIGLVIAGGLASAVTVKRSNEAQDRMSQTLARIQHNTEEPPRVTVNVPPAQVVVQSSPVTPPATSARRNPSQQLPSKSARIGVWGSAVVGFDYAKRRADMRVTFKNSGDAATTAVLSTETYLDGRPFHVSQNELPPRTDFMPQQEQTIRFSLSRDDEQSWRALVDGKNLVDLKAVFRYDNTEYLFVGRLDALNKTINTLRSETNQLPKR